MECQVHSDEKGKYHLSSMDVHMSCEHEMSTHRGHPVFACLVRYFAITGVYIFRFPERFR